MSQLDLDQARQYALRRLECELSPRLFYHRLAHTRDDVVPAAERYLAMIGVNGEASLLVRTAAYFHDLGFIERATNHEAIGVQIAAEVLPNFGYEPTHIWTIGGMILATKLPQSPHTLLEQVLADADLDLLGRDDFLALNQALRAELAASGKLMTDEQWYDGQLRFIQSHRYWTAAARALRDARKQENIEALTKLLSQSQARNH